MSATSVNFAILSSETMKSAVPCYITCGALMNGSFELFIRPSNWKGVFCQKFFYLHLLYIVHLTECFISVWAPQILCYRFIQDFCRLHPCISYLSPYPEMKGHNTILSVPNQYGIVSFRKVQPFMMPSTVMSATTLFPWYLFARSHSYVSNLMKFLISVMISWCTSW